jgi:hypothetical protein
VAETDNGVVVTEGMLTEMVQAGDLESLTIWARQGVRVTTVEPLYFAVQGGFLEVVRCLVQQMGADVNQILYGDKPLIVAAKNGCSDLVRLLVELGAEVGAEDEYGYTALNISARDGHYPTTQYLVEDAGANMEDVNKDGNNAWAYLIVDLELDADDNDDEVEEDHAALTALLRVLVLRGAPPPALVALLSPEPARVVQEGTRLRARLPAYLAHRRAYLDSRCPRISVLPGVLRALINILEGPATTEELWATGLGQAP